MPLTKAATGHSTLPKKVKTIGDFAAVVTQSELAELLEIDERILELLREASARRECLADRVFGPTKIEPGPLGVMLLPTPGTAPARSASEYSIQTRHPLEVFHDHRGLNPRVIRVIRCKPAKGTGGVLGDPRKVGDYCSPSSM